MRNLFKLGAAAALLLAPGAAMAADALSAFNNEGVPSAPFSFGGFNAGSATFSPFANCFGVAGFQCRQASSFSGPAPTIGKVAAATNIGAATLVSDHLNVLAYNGPGPSAAIFYNFDGAAPVDLVASFKALANGPTAEIRIALFRQTFGMMGPSPADITSILVNDANRSGTLTTTLTMAGIYGVRVMPTDSAPGSFDQRTDWIGLNLRAGSQVAPVPEPASWALMLLGFGAAGAAMRVRARPAFA